MAKQPTRKSKPGTRRPAARTSKARPSKAARPKAAAKKAAPRQRRPPAAAGAIDGIAKRIIAVTAANDEVATLALYADDVESIEMSQAPMVGLDAIKRKMEMWRGMTTSATFRPRTVAIAGNTIVIEWEGTVVLAGTGKTVSLNEVAVHEIAGGKIGRERYYYDPTALQP